MTLYQATVTLAIDAAHQLFLPYESKCNEEHGHTYNIEVTVEGPLNYHAMVVDFTHIKGWIRDRYDHKNLNKVMGTLATTAENLAFDIREWVVLRMAGVPWYPNAQVTSVRVWETPGNVVAWLPGKW